MKGRIRVNEATARDCAANPGTNVSGRFQFVSFNTQGNVSPNLAGDVHGIVRVLRQAGDPPGELRVQGVAFECVDANCTQTQCVSPGCVGTGDSVDLGTAQVGQWVTGMAGIDFTNDQLVFQRGSQPIQTISYAGKSDADPAAGPVARARIGSNVPNCLNVGDPRPVGWMDANFDDIQLNQSAIP
jgi:hypothetical protein